ncbi:M23 family metallopeptidase [Alkalihalobacillus sp. CinArs1]|uniref:M23 family metallopeptidase n=1 Tax=Alkalihalobacillus sp. CinArs1 TaxID=2995314 RepID=UPI0022DD1358|nr:M23 family metallopeptidase [Alkalihalobacillus sp. CinArs1]
MGDENKKSHPIEKSASKWQKLARKRWIYPAVYLGFAALVLTAVLWMQGGQENAEEPRDLSGIDSDRSAYDADEKSVPVLGDSEVFKVPASEDSGVFVQKQYYDAEASTDEQKAALVFYNNTYYQNSGIDYAKEDGASFEVVAAMSGKVVKAEKDQLLGNVVHIEHADGVVTVYESLDKLEVAEGDKVKQGDELGTAGTNTFDTDAGVHVHFEVRKDGTPVNPLDVFNQPSSAVEVQDSEEKAGNPVTNPSASEGNQGVDSEKDAEEEAEKDAAEEKGSKDTEDADEKGSKDSNTNNEKGSKDSQ